jgi:cytochrome c553
MPSHRVAPIARLLAAVVFAFAAGMAAPAVAAQAQPDPRAGAAISGQCAACHGSNGVSVATNIPNLAGQHYPYLLARMQAFKNGSEKSAIMNEMSRPLSEQQIEDLSAYFASIPIQVGTPGHGG